jgi:hypothetical protein
VEVKFHALLALALGLACFAPRVSFYSNFIGHWAGFDPDTVRSVSWEQNRGNKLKFTIQGMYKFTPNPLKNKTNLHM